MNAIKHISNKPLLAGAFVLQRYSMENAPVKIGFLKNSHYSQPESYGASMNVGADYAVYQEFGTSKMKAHPYVRPALDTHKNEIVQAIKDEAEKEIRKAAQK